MNIVNINIGDIKHTFANSVFGIASFVKKYYPIVAISVSDNDLATW